MSKEGADLPHLSKEEEDETAKKSSLDGFKIQKKAKSKTVEEESDDEVIELPIIAESSSELPPKPEPTPQSRTVSKSALKKPNDGDREKQKRQVSFHIKKDKTKKSTPKEMQKKASAVAVNGEDLEGNTGLHPDVEELKNKKLGRNASLFFRTTSLFRIRRNPNKDEEQELTERPPEFIYANIMVNDKQNEQTNVDHVGQGMNLIGETTYIEREFGQELLAGWRTNDTFYFSGTIEQMFDKTNKRALFCGSILLLFMLMLIIMVFWWFVPDDKPIKWYDHSKVIILPLEKGGNWCQYNRICQEFCDNYDIENLEGCCMGCPILGQCNFNITVGWHDLNTTYSRQKIFLLITTDGEFYFHSGFAPPVANGSVAGDNSTANNSAKNGTRIIPNACLSIGNQLIAVVACLSPYNITNQQFVGFPADFCFSTWGRCFHTNDVMQEDLPCCKPDGTWKGNDIDQNWAENFPPIWTTKNRKHTIYGESRFDDD